MILITGLQCIKTSINEPHIDVVLPVLLRIFAQRSYTSNKQQFQMSKKCSCFPVIFKLFTSKLLQKSSNSSQCDFDII